MSDIGECRTEALGAERYECDQCGEVHYVYHSCKNRHCPKCHDSREWMEKQRKLLLPVSYFHLVFTLPEEIREIVRSNQRILLNVLCRAGADSLMELAKDPHYVGGKIGLLAVIHTWTRALIYHPHLHCLVPGGGLSEDGNEWMGARRNFLVPVKALFEIFRAKFMEMAREELPEVEFPEKVWEKKWVAYSKPTVQGTEKVLTYLGRYVDRVAITNRRILSVENGKVEFRYKDSREERWKTMSLDAQEFIRRFLQHVLPRGFHKVRSYGLLSPSNRPLLNRAKEILSEKQSQPHSLEEPKQEEAKRPLPEPKLCPSCGKGRLLFVGRMPRKLKEPP